MKSNQNLSSTIFAICIFLASCSPKESNDQATESASSEAITEVSSTTTAVADVALGEAIVTDATKCAMCHKLTEEKLIGPGLKGVTKKRTEEWLTNMIKDPIGWVEKDAEAKKLFEEYNKVPMTHIELTDQDIANVIAFLASNDEK